MFCGIQLLLNLCILVPWQLRVWQSWLLKSELALSLCLKVSSDLTHHLLKQCSYCAACHIVFMIVYSSSGLVEQINNFQTLRLKDLTALNSDPFLTIDDDYFYHTEFPRRPEVSTMTATSPKYTDNWTLLRHLFHTLLLFVLFNL